MHNETGMYRTKKSSYIRISIPGIVLHTDVYTSDTTTLDIQLLRSNG